MLYNTPMVERDYERAKAAAAKELAKLLKDQERTERRILQLKTTLAALGGLSGKPTRAPKLTESIRSIFKAAPPDIQLSPIDVRNKLLEMGVDEADYSNLLASVHVILRRLAQYGEIKLVGGRSLYGKVVKDWLAELEGE
jgi:hypothetical protein